MTAAAQAVDIGKLREEFQRRSNAFAQAAKQLKTVETLVGSGKNDRLSENGRQRIIEQNRNAWLDCPVGCLTEGRPKKHRASHAHIRNKNRLLAAAQRRKAA